MAYEPWEAERDAAYSEMYDEIAKELYPEHKDRAIEEFTRERLCSYYKRNSFVMRPAVDALQEGNRLVRSDHFAAAARHGKAQI